MRRLLLYLFVFACSPLSALEISATFDLSNLDFARDRGVTATSLPGQDFLWGVGVSGSQELTPETLVTMEYRNDPILRQIIYTRLQYTDAFFRVTIGPFFGIFNAPDTLLQSGLSTSVQIFAPGIATVGLRSDTSLSGRLVVEGDYIQERSELSLGFFVPNALPTVYIRSKRYSYRTDAGENVDSLTEYGLETVVFQKNIPYRVTLDFAYHFASRQFVETGTTTHGYGALVLGTDVQATVADLFDILLDLETSIYTFGTDFLVGAVSSETFRFRARAGVSIPF